MNKSEIRTLFPHTSNGHIYLNHAAISPLSNKVKLALERFISDRNSGRIDNFEHWMKLTEETRELIADLIKADDSDRITFMGNTSDALSAVAEGISWNKGDEIILNTLEFPSNIQPFRILEKKGVKLVYLEPDDQGKITPGMIESVINPNTKMVSISYVQYLNGFRADLNSIGAICKKHGIFFVVDGIQGVGATRIDVEKWNIDALANGCHKWLMSPMGIGFLYMSTKLSKTLHPAKTGWLSVDDPWALSDFDQDWLPVSKHLETGTYNTIGIVGLNASLKHLLEIGMDAIEQEILGNIEFLFSKVSKLEDVDIVTPKEIKSHAGIFTFKMRDDQSAEAIVNHLKTKNITISARQGFIRLSPHYYNTKGEIQTVLDTIF